MTLILKEPQIRSFSSQDLEDRCANRVNLSLPGKLQYSSFSAVSVTIKDLSLSGFACETDTIIPIGTRCWLTIPGLESMRVENIWNDGNTIGCAFQDLLSETLLESIIARYKEPIAYNI